MLKIFIPVVMFAHANHSENENNEELLNLLNPYRGKDISKVGRDINPFIGD